MKEWELKDGFKHAHGRNNWFIESPERKSNEELVYVATCWNNCIFYLQYNVLGLGAKEQVNKAMTLMFDVSARDLLPIPSSFARVALEPSAKEQTYPCIGLDRPLELQQVESSRISRQSVHEIGKVVSLTPRLPFHTENIPVTQFCYRRSRSQGHSAARRI